MSTLGTVVISVPTDRESWLRELIACTEAVLVSLHPGPTTLPSLHAKLTAYWSPELQKELVVLACRVLAEEGLAYVVEQDPFAPAVVGLTDAGAALVATRNRLTATPTASAKEGR